MLSGYNTNVPFKGDMYHVQTEDGGRSNPVISTLLFHKGAIIDSIKSGYADLLIDEDWKDKLVARMKEQHKQAIKAIMSGRYAEELVEPQSKPPEDINVRILEYI